MFEESYSVLCNTISSTSNFSNLGINVTNRIDNHIIWNIKFYDYKYTYKIYGYL